MTRILTPSRELSTSNYRLAMLNQPKYDFSSAVVLHGGDSAQFKRCSLTNAARGRIIHWPPHSTHILSGVICAAGVERGEEVDPGRRHGSRKRLGLLGIGGISAGSIHSVPMAAKTRENGSDLWHHVGSQVLNLISASARSSGVLPPGSVLRRSAPRPVISTTEEAGEGVADCGWTGLSGFRLRLPVSPLTVTLNRHEYDGIPC